MPFLDAGRPASDRASDDRARERILWILEAARARRAATADRDERPASLHEAADRVVSQIERLEIRKARLEGQLVDAYAALHAIEEQHLASTTPSSPVPLTADQAQEIAWATGVGVGEVSRRLELATAPRRHRVLRERLRAGTVSLYRALRVVAEDARAGRRRRPGPRGGSARAGAGWLHRLAASLCVSAAAVRPLGGWAVAGAAA